MFLSSCNSAHNRIRLVFIPVAPEGPKIRGSNVDFLYSVLNSFDDIRNCRWLDIQWGTLFWNLFYSLDAVFPTLVNVCPVLLETALTDLLLMCCKTLLQLFRLSPVHFQMHVAAIIFKIILLFFSISQCFWSCSCISLFQSSLWSKKNKTVSRKPGWVLSFLRSTKLYFYFFIRK